jgi:alkaline phosphatase
LIGLFLAGCKGAADSSQPLPVSPPAPAAQAPGPSFRFGVVTDIHCADRPDDNRFGPRFYRQSLERLKECVADFNTRDLAFAIQLGDFIDGRDTQQESMADLDTALSVYNKLRCDHYHVIGNHCVAALSKKQLLKAFALSESYYAFGSSCAPGWQFIVLDGNGPEKNPFGKTQIEWLDQTLQAAAAKHQKAIVFCHFPLIKEAAPSWMTNAGPVLKLMEDSHCVVAYICGHEHGGGYGFHNGIHHVTLKGMVDYPKDATYGMVEVYPDHLKLIGHGKQASITMYFNQAGKVAQ